MKLVHCTRCCNVWDQDWLVEKGWEHLKCVYCNVNFKQLVPHEESEFLLTGTVSGRWSHGLGNMFPIAHWTQRKR